MLLKLTASPAPGSAWRPLQLCSSKGRNATASSSVSVLQLTKLHPEPTQAAMSTPPSSREPEVSADEVKAAASAAPKKTRKQQQSARKSQKQQQQQQQQQQEQQQTQQSHQNQTQRSQPLHSSQISVAAACLLQGQRNQCVGELRYCKGLAEALEAANECKVCV